MYFALHNSLRHWKRFLDKDIFLLLMIDFLMKGYLRTNASKPEAKCTAEAV